MSALPREPFDAEEAAAARAYHSLPAGEPSPELDARILARVRVAGGARRRPRPWFLGAGMGTAAAAVMAAGLAWQFGWLGPDGTGPAPSSSHERTGRAMKAEEVVDRIEVEYVELERPASPPAPAPRPAEPARADAPQRQSALPRAAAPPVPPPAAPPQPAAPSAADSAPEAAPTASAVRDEAVARPQPFPAESLENDSAGAAATSAAKRATGPVDELGGLRATGSRRRAEALPPWTADDALAPDAWLERIRERVRGGDRQGAQHSLRLFVLTHPRRAVPPELQRLLVE